MPRSTRTVWVRPVAGEQFRYHVESWETPEHPHLVDLIEEDGNGRCDCRDFVTRCFPNYTKSGGKIIPYGRLGKPNRNRTQCRHICAALTKDVPIIYRRISRKLRQQQTPA